MLELFEGDKLIDLIKSIGYLGLFLIIFAESGLFFGFFLPGDSLIFTAGFLASQGFLNVYVLVILLFIAAVTGDNVGYWFGAKVGPKIFHKKESLFFKREYLQRAEKFYQKYGRSTIILARFMPIVRTFAPIVAGVGKMNYRIFFAYNILGGFIWTMSMTFAGYFLTKLFPGIENYLFYIVLFIIFTSFIPPIIHLVKQKLPCSSCPKN